MRHDLMEDVNPSDVVVKDDVDVVGRRFGTFVGEESTRPRRSAAHKRTHAEVRGIRCIYRL